MKKVAYLLFITLFAVSLLMSCKSKEKCPAYSKVEKNKVEKHI